MKRLQGQIVAKMGRSCSAVCSPSGVPYFITYNPVSKLGISRDNLLLLQAQHPDIYDEYVTVSESRRFHIKEQREEAA